MAGDATPKGRATAEQMDQLRAAALGMFEIPVGIETFRAWMLFIQTQKMDGLRGNLVAIADARPGRPVDAVFTTNPAGVVIDTTARKAIA